MRNNKAKDILDLFIDNANRKYTLEELSSIFMVSERQIKNYINQINDEETIIIKTKGCYSLLSGYRDNKTNEEYLPSQRVNIIISRLLTSESLNIFDIADELYVSRPTIENDLKKVRKTIESFRLKLVLTSDILTLNGKEENLRKLSSYMIRNTEYKGTDFILFSNPKFFSEILIASLELYIFYM